MWTISTTPVTWFLGIWTQVLTLEQKAKVGLPLICKFSRKQKGCMDSDHGKWRVESFSRRHNRREFKVEMMSFYLSYIYLDTGLMLEWLTPEWPHKPQKPQYFASGERHTCAFLKKFFLHQRIKPQWHNSHGSLRKVKLIYMKVKFKKVLMPTAKRGDTVLPHPIYRVIQVHPFTVSEPHPALRFWVIFVHPCKDPMCPSLSWDPGRAGKAAIKIVALT